jgi:O-antigen/teichoic acid export membrane protein
MKTALLSPSSPISVWRLLTQAASACSHRRYRRALTTGVTSLAAKLVVLATTIVCLPLTFRYLGPDRYGLWMTITSLVLFLGFADFGLGNGLTSAIAEADGRDDESFAHQQVSCAFYLLVGIALTVLGSLAVAYRFIPWTALYHTRTALASAEAPPATAVLILCCAINMPLGVVLRVQLGYQKGFIGDLWTGFGNLLALFSVFLAVKLNAGLPWLVAALAGAPLIGAGINFLIQFGWRTPRLRPHFRLLESDSMLLLAKSGFLFFLQQCFGLIYFVSDNVVISRMLDSPHVAQFSVMQRIFSLGLVSQYFMAPLWPAFGEALARNDFEWAHKTLRRAIVGSLIISGGCGMFLLFASRSIALRWTGIDPGPIDGFRVGLALWVILVGYVAAMNAFLNQKGLMGKHLVFFGAASIGALLLKFYLVQQFSLAGIVWATLAAFAFLYVVPAAYLAFSGLQAKRRNVVAEECVAC